uniref:Uncharacterized protein n=1 Tax=Moniliophthora roreri TaxID=221103 RepID=A0A0W0FNI5_MONRR
MEYLHLQVFWTL